MSDEVDRLHARGRYPPAWPLRCRPSASVAGTLARPTATARICASSPRFSAPRRRARPPLPNCGSELVARPRTAARGELRVASSAMATAPSASPPPVKVGEFVQTPEAGEDERMTRRRFRRGRAGRAGWSDPARTAARAEPATASGWARRRSRCSTRAAWRRRLLSGAVVNPSALRDLLPGEDMAALPGCYGQSRKEAVYLMTQVIRGPDPDAAAVPQQGQPDVLAVAARTAPGELSRGAGRMVLPETDAAAAARGGRGGARCRDRRRGARPGGRAAGQSSRGSRCTLGRPCSRRDRGRLAGAAIEHFGLQRPTFRRSESRRGGVWRVAKPLDHVIHTLAGRSNDARRIARWAAASSTRWGRTCSRSGWCWASTTALDALGARLAAAAQDPPDGAAPARGGERIGGREDDSGGRIPRTAVEPVMPGRVLTGDSAGFVNVPELKGSTRCGRDAGGGGDLRGAEGGRTTCRRRGALTVRPPVRSSHIWSDLRKVRNMRQALGKGFAVGGRRRADGLSRGGAAAGRLEVPPRRGGGGRAEPGQAGVPGAGRKLTFDKLSSVFLSGNRSRDDQPNHIRIQENVPREVAEAWVAMCPAAVYEIGRDDGGPTVQLKLAPSNCVQCGAITAKGGRLTPPEGGSGPEYTLRCSGGSRPTWATQPRGRAIQPRPPPGTSPAPARVQTPSSCPASA